MQQAHRHGIGFEACKQFVEVALECYLVESIDYVAAGIETLTCLDHIFARHQWLGACVGQVIVAALLLALQFENVAESHSRNQGGAAAAALDQGVGGNGRTVHQYLGKFDRVPAGITAWLA